MGVSAQYPLSADAGYMFNTVCTCCALHVLECKCAMVGHFMLDKTSTNVLASAAPMCPRACLSTPLRLRTGPFKTRAMGRPTLRPSSSLLMRYNASRWWVRTYSASIQMKPKCRPPPCLSTSRTRTHLVIVSVYHGLNPAKLLRGGKLREPVVFLVVSVIVTKYSIVLVMSSKFCQCLHSARLVLTVYSRHQKTHMARSERPHKCESCTETFLYPKDLERHQQKHIHEPSAKNQFQCRHPGCGNLFSRRDNLLRHQRRQHFTPK